jgi:Na+-transporting NADH:ubiquinone oxidoreductase subunit B
MKFLRKLVDNLEPKVQKSKILKTVFGGFNTFLFVPNHVTSKGAHIRDGMDLKRTMIIVVIALQLAMLFGMYNIGHWHYASHGIFQGFGEGILQKFIFGFLQLLPVIIVSYVVGLGIEFLFAAKRGGEIEEGFLVSGILIPLIMPPDIPLWMVAVATAFAVIIAKEAFGGTGQNVLNVALTTRVFVFFAYPLYISGDKAWITWDTNWLHNLIGLGVPANTPVVEGFTGATPLGLAAGGLELSDKTLTGLEAVTHQYSWWDMFLGFIPGSVGETSALFIILGLVLLLITRIASWRIVVSMFAGALFMALIFNAFSANPLMAIPWHYQLVMGGFFFAMAFMATDPVTAAQTARGKLVYGFLIGVVGMIVRILNPAYPEGWMMAILLLNVFAPLIDHVVIQSNIKKRLARG